MNLDLGTLLPLCQREDISHKGHGMAAAELKWNLVGQPLSGNTSHSQRLQDLKTRQRIHRRLVGWKNNKQLPGCPAALAWGQKRHAACLMLLSAVKWDNSEVQRAQESWGFSVGDAGGGLACSARAPRRVEKQQAVRRAFMGQHGARCWTPAWVYSPPGGSG